MAKLIASEYCAEVTTQSFRIHGGYGYSKEYEIERLMREAPFLLIGEGTSEIQKTIISRGLLKEYALKRLSSALERQPALSAGASKRTSTSSTPSDWARRSACRGCCLGAVEQVALGGRRGQPVLGQRVERAVVDRVVADGAADALDQPAVAVEDAALLRVDPDLGQRAARAARWSPTCRRRRGSPRRRPGPRSRRRRRRSRWRGSWTRSPLMTDGT